MAQGAAHSFFSLAFMLCSLSQAAGVTEVYHITTDSELCTATNCLTLPEFTTNLSHYLYFNTILVFLPGMHYLSINISISNVGKFLLTSESITAQIVCKNYSHIKFNNSQDISISNLEFIGCGGNEVEYVEKFVVNDTIFKGQNTSSTALEIITSTALIFNCVFNLNKRGKPKTFAASGPGFFIYQNALAGGAIIATYCVVGISQSRFENNGAEYGGTIYAQVSFIIIHNSIFTKSSGDHRGGVLFSVGSNITIVASEFNNNAAKDEGGVLYCLGGIIIIKVSDFGGNHVLGEGGVLYSRVANIIIGRSKFDGNRADRYGIEGTDGVLHSTHGTIGIVASEFNNNIAKSGGVLYTEYCIITIIESVYYNNSATSKGGILYSESSTITVDSAIDGALFPNYSSITREKDVNATSYEQISALIINGSLQILSNIAEYAVIYLSDSELNVNYSVHLKFLDNVGSLVAFNSNITFMGYVEFKSNHPKLFNAATGILQEGGAITLIQSNAYVNGDCNLYCNRAESGGGLLSTESKLYVNGHITIAYNTATKNGGGIYLSNSELTCLWRSSILLNNNDAGHKGGGLHAISSSIKAFSAYSQNQNSYTGAQLNITKNIANMGGGMSFEANTKFYILKYNQITYNDANNANTTVFTANSAHTYGGAVYVDDDTNSGSCSSNSKTECFFQVLAVHGKDSFELKTQSIYFSQNQANISGSTLYGGLLDRCAVSQFAEVHYNLESRWYFVKGDDGVSYFRNVSIPVYNGEVSVVTNLSTSSGPVKVCLCIKNKHICSHQAYVEVKKGEAFNVSLVAVDQVQQPVNATIHASLKFAESGLSEGQLTTKINGECTDLVFNVVSPHNYESLTLYASDGPCKDADLSRSITEIHFLPCRCPIGFQVSGKIKINCTCDCHRDISQYTQYCDSQNGSFIKKSQTRAWISYINNTNLTGYLVYPNCPFDYCKSFPLSISLNQPNGADAQCAFNRSSLLCGSCQPGLSLSLSSSCCLRCPRYWPVQLIAITLAAILAGIALVALLLLLNMTVAVGSLNGLVFYANIVYANKSILLPFQGTSLVTVLISWLNLELGIDVCYFPGMDTYVKIWLQLAFPAYVIILVVLVIMISSYSMRFSKLIGKKDPVATLATLILLSYAKVLEICFESLSVGILKYPDGTGEPLWLPDATVKYLSGKHIPLFIAAVLILLICLIYAALLFLWQWLLYLPDWKVFKWTRDQKLQAFIESHHIPFMPKHRYWTGLLLIVRAILYLVAAANISNDPQLALSTIIFTVSCILLIRSFLQSKVYRELPINILETSYLLNLLFFSIFTWYSLSNTNVSRKAVANISVLTAFFVLLLIILYHVYTYTTVFIVLKKTKPFQMTHDFLTRNDQEMRRHLSLPPDDDVHRFNELLDIIDRPVNTDDYRVPLLQQKSMEPTKTVVEVHQPHFPPPESDCDKITNHSLAAAVQISDV